MKTPYTKSGKRGNTVWQCNRYGQICYPYYIPYDPRTPAQVKVRNRFGAVSARWRTLTDEQRRSWRAAARTEWTRKRFTKSCPITGYNYFVRVNTTLANRALAQVDLPPAQPPEGAAALEPRL